MPKRAKDFTAIHFDFNYYKTWFKDNVRNSVRRFVHRLKTTQEINTQRIQLLPQQQQQQTLSTCVITMNAAGHIGPLVKHAKTFSDEVVIGVDSKTTDNTVEIAKAAGADKVFVIENNALTCNGALEELVKACTSNWVLRLDDDEYMEPRFLELKQALIQQTQYTHFKFPRLHVCNTQPLQWVDDGYLYPDFQLRLFKNDLNLLSFPGAVGHTSISCAGKRGKVHSVNIVHLNLAINSREKRETKLEKYIKRLNGAWVHPINAAALLFEDYKLNIKPYSIHQPAFEQLLCDVVAQSKSQLATQKAVTI